MKVTIELTTLFEDALLKVRYDTHLSMAKMSSGATSTDSLRERIISDALNILKIPIENFVEKHFVVDKIKEL